MALENYLAYIGVSTIRSQVGDRYVLEEMRKNGCNFGGEQSGHLVLSNYSTTGDGLIAALQVLSTLSESDKPASELLNLFELLPQVLKNAKFDADKENPLQKKSVQDFIKQKEEEIAENGRILVRKSGTENLIRVMIEGSDEKKITEIADQIIEKLTQASK